MIPKHKPHVTFVIPALLIACVALILTTDHQSTIRHMRVKLQRFQPPALQQTDAATGSPAIPPTIQHTAPATPPPDLRPTQHDDRCLRGEAVPTPDELLSTFKGQWGEQSCVVLRNACMDEGTFVTFGDDPYPPHGPDPDQLQVPWHRYHIGHANINLAEFGDVAGNIIYPNPIIRPGGVDEESPDLRPPHFSRCVRPVVFYMNHNYMFGDWWINLPTFMHALKAGAWDRRYAIILATGGQKLERWQKLMMQPLTDHPVVSLSEASSRALAAQHTTARQPAADTGSPPSAPAAAAAAAAPAVTSARARRAALALNAAAAAAAAAAAEDAGTAAAVPVTAYGRCYELLTVCTISNVPGQPAKPFVPKEPVSNPGKRSNVTDVSGAPRATWAGAQYIKQHYMQQYAQEYHYLLPQYTRLQEPGAFRVVFAVKPPVTADAVAAAAAAAGLPLHGSSSSSSSNDTGQGSANQKELTEEQLAVSYRQVLNVKELLQWCNAWKPTAATAADLQGMTNTGAAGGGAKRYTHAVCVAHAFGRHGKVDVAPTSSSGSSIHKHLRDWTSQVHNLWGGGPTNTTATAAAESAQPCPGCDPDLDPRALMTDLAILDYADVVVGLHGAQLYNALFMPQHKTLVEVRPHGFTGGWPEIYFRDMLAKIDQGDGIFWFGMNTVNASNSRPGRWEQARVGPPITYGRDRHTRIEPAALEVLFRRIIWTGEDPAAYLRLHKASLTLTTDTAKVA